MAHDLMGADCRREGEKDLSSPLDDEGFSISIVFVFVLFCFEVEVINVETEHTARQQSC